MTPEIVVSLVQQALEVTMLLSAPLLLAALVTGLVVSVFQAATQINEMTLSFIPKLLAIFADAGAGRTVDAEPDGRLHPPSVLGHSRHDRLSRRRRR